MTDTIKGARGTHMSIHDGNVREGESPKTCIVIASGSDPAMMAQDMMEAAEAQQGYRYSTAPSSATVSRNATSICVTGEGGNVKDVVSKMVDALLPSQEPASAALNVVAA